MNAKAQWWVSLSISILVSMFGYIMGAAQPKDKWQWVQFIAGVGFVALGVVNQSTKSRFSTAQETDRLTGQ